MKNKLIKKIFEAPITYTKKLRDDIIPFTQKPSANRFSTPDEGDTRLEASELFSRFTADIIRKDVLFTR
jgi:hypothetical protein